MDLLTASAHYPVYGSADYRLQLPKQRHCKAYGHRDFNNPIVAIAALILNQNNNQPEIRRGRIGSLW
jgi:hypothetical protein